MKLARIAVAIAIATTMAGAFGATSDAEKVTGQIPAATTAQNWYKAGDRARQCEQGKAELDRQGFPQYVP